jgi:hypothetical protein
MSENVVNIRLNLQGVQAAVSQLGALSGAFAAISRALPGVGAGLSIGAALTAFTNGMKEAIASADAMGKAAQRAGADSVESFSKLAFAAKLSDVSQQDLIATARSYIKAMEEQGVAAGSLTDAILENADTFARMPDGLEKVRLANEKFGKSGQNLIPLLNQGSDAIRKMMAEADRLGVTISDDFAADASAFGDQMTMMQAHLDGFYLTLAKELLPEINKFLKLMNDFTSQSSGFGIAVEVLAGMFRAWVTNIALANYHIDLMVGTIKTLVDSFREGRTVGETFDALMKQNAESTRKLIERLKEIHGEQKRGAQEQKKSGDALAESEDQRIKRLTQLLEAERRLIDIRIAEQKLMIERAQMDAEERGFISESDLVTIRASVAQMEKLINLKRQLTSDALFGTKDEAPFLTEDEARKFENQDDSDLMAVRRFGRNSRFSDTDLRGQMTLAVEELQKSFGTVAQNIAQTFRDVIGSAISSISSNITGLIMRTQSWGEALRNIGNSVLSSLINGIVEMGVKWVMTHVIMKGAAQAFHIVLRALGWETTAQQQAQTASQTPGLATNAGLAAVGSYGSALAFLAVLGVAIAAFAGAFADGGMIKGPGGPRDDNLIAAVSPGEAVLNAATVRDMGGESTINALNSGNISPLVQPVALGSTAQQRDFNLHLYVDRTQFENRKLTQDEQDAAWLDSYNRNQHKFRA